MSKMPVTVRAPNFSLKKKSGGEGTQLGGKTRKKETERGDHNASGTSRHYPGVVELTPTPNPESQPRPRPNPDPDPKTPRPTPKSNPPTQPSNPPYSIANLSLQKLNPSPKRRNLTYLGQADDDLYIYRSSIHLHIIYLSTDHLFIYRSCIHLQIVHLSTDHLSIYRYIHLQIIYLCTDHLSIYRSSSSSPAVVRGCAEIFILLVQT